MIYTSYFSSKKYNKEDGVSIARYNNFWKGETYPNLYPSEELLNWFKKIDKVDQNDIWFTEQYERAYYEEILNKLDPHKVAADLEGKVLLCYEKSEDFCHRHLVAAWLNSYGYKVQEL